MQTLRPVRLALFLILLSVTSVSGQSLGETTSLRFAPASASLYCASLRNGEQLETFMASRAFAKLKSLPLVQMGLAQLQTQWESNDDWAPLRQMLEQPENQQLVKLILDGLSHEVFVMGDARVGKWVGTMAQVGNRINLAQLQATRQGIEPDEAVGQAMIKFLQDEPELLRIPSGVIGFRITDTKAANAQLDRLEAVVQQLIASGKPELEDRFSREQIGDASFLTLKLDGTLVPWNKALKQADLDDDDLEKLTARLRNVKLTISIGVHGDYLLLSTGENDDFVRSLGKGARLADHPKMQPLAQYFDKPIRSIGYASEDFVQQASATRERMDQLVQVARALMPMAPISEDIKNQVIDDVQLFANQAIGLVPRQGAMAGVSYATDGGHESVSYNWSENRSMDDSKPLTILNHLGDDPIAFYATRRKAVAADEKFVREWAIKLGQYFDRIAVPFMDDDQQELYGEIKKRMLPLLARLDVATQTQLKPAMADGQSAIVLNAPMLEAQWHEQMPPANDPVPLPQISCIWGVSDAELLKAGAAEYFDVLQDAIISMSEVLPEQVPPVDLPRPQSREVDGGTVYFYALPPMAGTNKAIAPNAGLSADTLVISLVPKTTAQLLDANRIEATGPLADVAERPLGSVWQFKMHRFVQMVRPWVKYGFQLAEEEDKSDPMVESHVSAVMDVLECIRTINGVAYRENGATVSHTRSEFKDLDE